MKYVYSALAVFFLFIGLSFLLPEPLLAANAPPINNRLVPPNYVEDGYITGAKQAILQNASNFEGTGMSAMRTLEKTMLKDIFGAIEGQTVAPGETDFRYVEYLQNKSAIAGITNSVVAMIDTPPATTALAIREFGRDLGFLPKQAYAQGQGVGFRGLLPLIPIWTAARNAAYVLMALFLIVIGFMVMFRKKIDPKTVVTVQSSLPRVVVTLLLITFSYAIVGLMIDLMYLTTGIGISLIPNIKDDKGVVTFNAVAKAGELMKKDSDLFTLLTHGLGGVIGGLKDVMPDVKLNIKPLDMSAVLDQASKNGMNQVGSGLIEIKEAKGDIVSWGPLLWVIVGLIYLVAWIRILLLLITSYIQILLSVILGPIQILFDALPGGNGFVAWLQHLFVSIIAFPVTVVFIVIANYLSVQLTQTAKGSLWSPPLVFGDRSADVAVFLIWVGMALSIPSVVAQIRESLKAKGALATGGGGLGFIASGASMLFSHWTQTQMLQHSLGGKGAPGTTEKPEQGYQSSPTRK